MFISSRQLREQNVENTPAMKWPIKTQELSWNRILSKRIRAQQNCQSQAQLI